MHGGGKRCQVDNCSRSAVTGGTPHCKAHGGGKRCQHAGCTKSALAGGRQALCSSHGGGKRCQHTGCPKGVQGGTPFCHAHGGGRRCQEGGCNKKAATGTSNCLMHGGGRRCQNEGCTKRAATGSLACMTHGRRCSVDDCSKLAHNDSPYCKSCQGRPATAALLKAKPESNTTASLLDEIASYQATVASIAAESDNLPPPKLQPLLVQPKLDWQV
jgi:hypothetical protein